MKKSAFVIVALLAASGGAAYYWQKHKPPAPPSSEAAADAFAGAPSVTIVKVTTTDFVETAAVSGSLAAREEILVSPEIEGYRVMELFADEGSRVTKGQVLATLATEPLDAQMAQNDAGLARGTAAIARAQSQITEAEAKLAEANAQFERAKPLKQSGYLSGAVFDQRDTAAKTAAAQLVAARDFIKSAQADKALTQAQRRELTWRRERTQVKAPTDGIVSRRNARMGALATSVGEPMFRIIEKGDVELMAEIVETELTKVKEGQKARITVPGAGDVEGTVRLVSPEIDKATRLGRVKIALGANPDLKIGAFAHGSIITAQSRGVAIPSSAAQFDPSGTAVQLVKGDRVEKKIIKTGLVAGELIEVRSGLVDGDVIVARAGTFLRDGDTIRAVEPSARVSETTSGAK